MGHRFTLESSFKHPILVQKKDYQVIHPGKQTHAAGHSQELGWKYLLNTCQLKSIKKWSVYSTDEWVLCGILLGKYLRPN